MSLKQTVIHCIRIGDYQEIDDRIPDLLLQVVWHKLYMGRSLAKRRLSYMQHKLPAQKNQVYV